MKTERPETETSRAEPPPRPYSPPVILSREPLEAVAALCTGGGPVTGKATPGICGALRS